ncbi:DUF6950 family protein [Allopontixanthobacter sediminis]|uniref:DUF6950 domain-containing protein n=1 Tax=Allopontixanthobacter sediminis TaxID=1689985 RepID=A0A845AXL5_9SPHN|nr:hypothetical protein [Allopontixanthobacter sediminis]MXP42995.1 hypothetical protein [Allopontixanthobacter sediminis]
MVRRDDWEARLGRFIADNRARPFEWGQHDCILMACAAVEAMTGFDAAKAYRGQYTDRAGSAKALRELGEGTLLKTVDAVFKRKPPSFAQRGDLVWFAGSVGVCMGAQGLFVGEERLADKAGLTMREGLIAIPRRDFVKAWAV